MRLWKLPHKFDHHFLAGDWGDNHPEAWLWFFIDTASKLIYIDNEFTKSGMTLDEVCGGIKVRCGDRIPEYGVIDPSANKKDRVSQRKMIDEYNRCFKELGGQWEWFGVRPGDRSERGYEITKRYFKKGMIKIHPRCKNLIYQLETVTREDKVGDDVVHALRYGCVNAHDSFYGMNVMSEEQEFDVEKLEKESGARILSLYDKRLFPNREMRDSQDLSWVFDEAV